MLIITRPKGQPIVIGGDVEVVVTEISRSGVKLGVFAPSSLTILRGEVHDAVERANREAALSEIAESSLLSPANLTESAPRRDVVTPISTVAFATDEECDAAKP
jgi:carbon storage regulator